MQGVVLFWKLCAISLFETFREKGKDGATRTRDLHLGVASGAIPSFSRRSIDHQNCVEPIFDILLNKEFSKMTIWNALYKHFIEKYEPFVRKILGLRECVYHIV